MRTIKITIGFLAAFFIIAGGLIAIKPTYHPVAVNPGNSTATSSADDSLPWVEVSSAHVYEVKADQKTVIRELQTGDTVAQGAIIKTDANAQAVVYFPDNSVIRLDKGSTVRLDEASFDSSSDTLKVQATLMLGRIWSKIIGLATPDSHWEVKTSNAVATVRGTAFGMQVDATGKSTIIGSEHTVTVRPIQAKTAKILENIEVAVTEKKVLEITNDDVDKMAAIKPTMMVGTSASVSGSSTPQGSGSAQILIPKGLMAVKDAPAKVLADAWVKQDQDQDAEVNQKMQVMQASGKDAMGAKAELRNELRQKLVQIKEERKIEKQVQDQQKQDEQKPSGQPAPLPVRVPSEIKQVLPIKAIQNLEVKAGITAEDGSRLEIVSPRSLEVAEGQTLSFEAVVISPAGARRTVTSQAQWKVVGSIGSMDKPGTFSAALGSDVSEIGTGVGAIVAAWKDEATGKTYLAKTGIITVKGVVDNSPAPAGS